MSDKATFLVFGFISKIEFKPITADLNYPIITIESYMSEINTNFTRMNIWNQHITSEIERGYIAKGKNVIARGYFSNTQYEKDGIVKYSTVFIAETVDVLEHKPD